MPYLPQLQETKQTEQLTETFGGYNHNMKIANGEFYDTKNLTTDYHPLLANRKQRMNVLTNYYPYYLTSTHEEWAKTFGFNIRTYVRLKRTVEISLTTENEIVAQESISLIAGRQNNRNPRKTICRIYNENGNHLAKVDMTPKRTWGETVDGEELTFTEYSEFTNTILDIEPNEIVLNMISFNELDAIYEDTNLNNFYIRNGESLYRTDLDPILRIKDVYGYIENANHSILLATLIEDTEDVVHIFIDMEESGIYTGEDPMAPNPMPMLASKGTRQLVNMGAYVVIFPDKVYINTADLNDYGSINAFVDVTRGSITATITPCTIDGDTITYKGTGTSAPSNPSNGDYWLDKSASIYQLKKYNASASMWVTVPTSYAKITSGVDWSKLKDNDAVTIATTDTVPETIAKTIEAIGGSKVIVKVTNNSIIIPALVESASFNGRLTVTRQAPDMDYVTECNNRIWGCKFGEVDGKLINEIYCCALGDFKNWERYSGISTDSYRASCGTDGPWTGAVTYNGNPLFFKEKYLHKVFVSSSGGHQIVDKQIDGVQLGSSRSLKVIADTLFYKSIHGVCAYTGTTPTEISSQLGNVKYYDAVAGGYAGKYYISMRDENNEWQLFVYDTKTRIWIREDSIHSTFFSNTADTLYMNIVSDRNVFCIEEGIDLEEHSPNVEWYAETGLMGYAFSDNYGGKHDIGEKYISRFNIRMMLPRGSECDLYMDYDSEGIWNHCGHIDGSTTKTFTLPVRPRRCDHFRFRIEGKGDVRIYSIARLYESGSDEQWN